MANSYYVDINNYFLTISGNGTESTPWNYNQYYNFTDPTCAAPGLTGDVQIGNGDSVYLRGIYNVDYPFIINNDITATDITIDSWNSSLNGPWVFSGNYYCWMGITDHIDITFKNGIISTIQVGETLEENVYGSTKNFKNVIFLNTINLTQVSGTNNFYGCSFIDSSLFIHDYGGIVSTNFYNKFYDSVFLGSIITILNDNKLTFEYCVFSGTSATVLSDIPTSAIESNVNNIFNWIPAATILGTSISASTSALHDIDIITHPKGLNFDQYGLSATTNDRYSYWNSNGYTNSLFNSKDVRRGPGAFHFPNNLYVDLERIASGSGTSGSPYNDSEFDTYFFTALVCDDIFNIKGTKNYTGNHLLLYVDNFGYDFTFKDWDQTLYGPWRMIIPTGGYYFSVEATSFRPMHEFGRTKAIFKNGMIFGGNSTFDGVIKLRMDTDLINMFIRGKSLEKSITPYAEFDTNTLLYLGISGSTIITTSDVTGIACGYNNVVTIKDSVLDILCIDKLDGSHETSAFVDWCSTTCLNASILSAGGQYQLNDFSASNIQYNLPDIVWPSTTGDQEDYSYSSLGTNITIVGSQEWN